MTTAKKNLKSEILALKHKGMPAAEIARQLGCSRSNVSLTLSKHSDADLRIAALPIDKFLWLVDEARKTGIYPAEMARCLLLDAIEEASGGG